MAITLQCPGCGRRYRLPDESAGKQATCQCGHMIRVPGHARESSPAPPGDWLEEEFADWHLPASWGEPPAEAVSPPLPSVGRPESQEQREKRPLPLRTIVGVLSIFYGAVMTLVLLGGLSLGSLGPLGLSMWSALVRVALAVAIAAGGVLILKGHEQGPACAGLCSILLCFFPLWSLLTGGDPRVRAGEPGAFFVLLAVSAVVYSIPVFVAVWALREEMAKQKDSDEIG